jgi:RimJ/RimL family protein N-acetyltransferase
MLQYGAYLKSKGYKVNEQPLDTIVSTARVDNIGSWKAHAKAGFQLGGICSNLKYGPELRYQMRKSIQ